MKKRIAVLIILITSIINCSAQYTKLIDFGDTTYANHPHGNLISDGTFLYGMTAEGGIGYGMIFRIKTDGTGYERLHDFDSINGFLPYGSLTSDGTFLYGLTYQGGLHGVGTFFKIMPDGTGYEKIFDFNDTANGAYPMGSLIYDGIFLYGMTSMGGGAYSHGTIFKVKPDGTEFTQIHDFYGSTFYGDAPMGSLIFQGDFLYGMTSGGGSHSDGTIFKVKSDGTEFTKILDFNGPNGQYPCGDLISDGTFLYGMTFQGGTSGMGNIFKIKLDGTQDTTLLNLDNYITIGINPMGSLISDGTFLYGMTNGVGNGTIIKIKQDGTAYSRIHNFDGINGAFPLGSLISDGTFLYGMTIGGGLFNAGVVFKLEDSSFSCIANYTKTYNSTLNTFDIIVDSATTAQAVSYHWDFGDGTTSDLAVPTHTYVTAGSYNVCMRVHTASGDFCTFCDILEGDTMLTTGFTVNVYNEIYPPPTTCIASYKTDYDSTLNTFILNVDSTTTAIATSYHWDFGDGSTSTLATPTHVYAVDSLYNVCMKVHYADGDSCSYCHTIGIDSAGNIIRDGGFTLNVHNATTGVSENTSNEIAVSIYPNPTTGIFQLAVGNGQLTSTATLSIYNVVGEKIYVKDGKQLNASTTIDLSDQPNGIYFMQLKTEASTLTKKIIINK